MKQCTHCDQKMRSDYRYNRCRSCRGICHCGMPKDWRAEECRSCGMSRKLKAAWADPVVSQRMRAGLAKGGEKRRTRLEDLSKRKWQVKLDGRRWNWYWPEGSDTKRTLYRYQWTWIMANGPILEGHVVHHINHDVADDRLENLELMAWGDHAKLHGAIAHANNNRLTWICGTCGTEFQRYRRQGNQDRKYCSVACYRVAQRSMI